MGVCWLQIHIWGINWQRISAADILLLIKCVFVAFFPRGASRAILATTGLVVGNWRLSWASLSACSAFHRYCKISNNHRPTLLASTHRQWSSSFVTRQILKSLTQWVVKSKTFTNPKLFFPSQQFMSRRLDCPNEKHLCKSCPTMWVIASPGNLWQSVSPCFYSPIVISFWRIANYSGGVERLKRKGQGQKNKVCRSLLFMAAMWIAEQIWKNRVVVEPGARWQADPAEGIRLSYFSYKLQLSS